MTQPSPTLGSRLIGTPTGAMRSAAVARPVPSIERAMAVPGEPGAIFARATEQHEVFVRTLRYFGVDVSTIETSSEDPYGAAIAETAVPFDEGAVLMRPSSITRRGEADRAAEQLAKIGVPLAGRVTAPGLLDGADVLLAGTTAFVGVGMRGNDAGREGFARIAKSRGYRVIEVRLAPGIRALRSVANAIDAHTIVLASEGLDTAPFGDFRTVLLERGEESGAGVLCIGEAHVIADARYRTTLQRLRRAGITVEGIDLYEFEKIGIVPAMLALPLRRD